MTAEPMTVARDKVASVAAVRSFVGKRRRRSWVDWYVTGFALVIAGIYFSDIIASPLSRLSGQASRAAAAHTAALQAVTGAGLVIGAGAGLLLLAQALGPLVLSPADSSWLLLTPLSRRGILRRPALSAAVGATLAGALLGVLALAMAGPYLRTDSINTGSASTPGGSLPGSWLALCAAAGAGSCLAAVAGEALAQPGERARALVRAACAALAVVALAGALAGQGSTALVRTVITVFGGLTTPDFTAAAVAAVAVACLAWLLLWRSAAAFPAAALRSDSARSGQALLAAGMLNFSLLFWIAEDNHWRGRLLRSRPWPRLPPAMAVAWADWRRISRRPGRLAVLTVAAVFPALLGAAFTGQAHGILIAAALVAGAMAAGLPGTTGARRDTDSAALRRLLGVGPGQVLAARTVLPALLCTAWLALALLVLPAVGALGGWWWPLLALAGPGVAAGVLRLARTAPVDPSDRGPDTPMGNTPPWMLSRLYSIAIAVIGSYPLLAAVVHGHAGVGTVVSQLLVSAVVLGGYLMIAGTAGG
jgi:Family of unknown function (DUF6297)